MAEHPILPRLDDILEAIQGVETIVRGMDLDGYKANFIARRAVERCIEIVSEASRHLPADLTGAYPHIPWHDIRGIGNRPRHEYQRVDDLIMWMVATKSLPEMKPAIEEMLKAGSIKALVCTSSLELGIDMGAVDLVVQIEAPPSVASGMQRIGRAGHQVGAPSAGIIFPKYRADLIACAAVAGLLLRAA